MRLRGLALALCLLASTALAASSIDATKPVTGSALSSSVIRANFAAAASDITALQASVATAAANALQKSGNLSDLTSASTARANLGLAAVAASGSASDLSTGTLPTARMPAMTGGDCTTSAGAVSITCSVTSMTGTLPDADLSANVPLINAANNFSADQTVTSTDAGAGVGPSIIMDRNSASPAAADIIGKFIVRGRSSTGVARDYANFGAVIDSATNAAEQGHARINTIQAGANADRIYVGLGLYTAAATGGDKGADTVNATEVYAGGDPVRGSTTVASGSLPAAATQTISSVPATCAYLVVQVTGWSQATNTARLFVRVGTGSGDSTAGNYVGYDITGTTVTNWTTNAGASLTDGPTQLVAQTGSATVTITGYQAGPHKTSQARVLANTTEAQSIGTYIGVATAIDTVVIGTSAAGNFDAGTYAVYCER